MKVWFVTERETFKDEAKRKKYYEIMDTLSPSWEKMHEGVKATMLGGWSDSPGYVMGVSEYENMEEFSKVWSDEEFQKNLLILRNHCKKFKVRIMRPTISVP